MLRVRYVVNGLFVELDAMRRERARIADLVEQVSKRGNVTDSLDVSDLAAVLLIIGGAT
jgi:hypothetical protein